MQKLNIFGLLALTMIWGYWSYGSSGYGFSVIFLACLIMTASSTMNLYFAWSHYQSNHLTTRAQKFAIDISLVTQPIMLMIFPILFSADFDRGSMTFTGAFVLTIFVLQSISTCAWWSAAMQRRELGL